MVQSLQDPGAMTARRDANPLLTVEDGYHDLPEGKLASLVTYLEMTQRPAFEGRQARQDLSLRQLGPADVAIYRSVFRLVGERWLWVSRLEAPDAVLEEALANPDTQAYALQAGGSAQGLLELDFSDPDAVEIVYFGVSAALIGTGAGHWLMDRALEMAWARPVSRVWLHTCTLDHPGAVAFYQRGGFRPYKLAIEIIDDPRLTGAVPREIRPDLPPLPETTL